MERLENANAEVDFIFSICLFITRQTVIAILNYVIPNQRFSLGCEASQEHRHH